MLLQTSKDIQILEDFSRRLRKESFVYIKDSVKAREKCRERERGWEYSLDVRITLVGVAGHGLRQGGNC